MSTADRFPVLSDVSPGLLPASADLLPASADLLPASADMAALVEQICDGFLTLDTEWRVTFVSEKAAPLFERPREDLQGRLIWEVLPENFGPEFYEVHRQAAGALAPFQREVFLPSLGCWFECQAYPAPTGYSLLFRDVTEQRAAQRRLKENEQRYRSLFDQNADAVFSFDLNGRFVDANAACEVVSGCTPAELRGSFFLPLVVPEHQDQALALFAQARHGERQHEEIAIRHKSGRRVELDIAKMPIVVNGAVTGIYGIAKDITARRQAEAAMRDSDIWLRAVAEASPVPMTITRWEDGLIFFANRHVRELFGVSLEEEVGSRRTEEFFVSPGDRATLIKALTERGHVQNWESQLRRMDGTTFWASGAFQRMAYKGEEAIFSVYYDVSAQKRLLDEARSEADQDPLTGLLNHRAFHKRLEEEASRALRAGTSLAVAVLDLDNFKFFNDAYGHATGDEVLRQVAGKLQEICRSSDTLSRFGGDEFALLMPEAGGETEAAAVAARLAADLGDVRYQPAGHCSAIPIGLSLGVALFPAEAPTRLAVLQLADERLLRDKAGAHTNAEARQVRAALRRTVKGFSMLDALVNAVDAKDRYTRRHSEDVMTHALRLARRLGLDEAAQHTAAVAALLHDIGKIGVSDQLLRKPSALTDEEFDAVRLHPGIGAAIIAAVPDLGGVLEVVRHHHERWDGGGYPDGLKGEECPLLARLLAVADGYSAMTMDRPYRRGREPMAVRRILEEGAGSQWDPACVQAFLASQEE